MLPPISRPTATRRWRRSLPTILGSLVALGLVGAGAELYRASHAEPILNIPTVRVQRIDVHPTLRVPGQVQSSQRTLIECELENMRYYNEGRSMSAGGSSTILEIIPDGAQVKAGDTLARLDGSDYEELVRQQSIEVEESRAEYRQALLELESAQVRLREYSEGLFNQMKENYKAAIVLAEADHKRQTERVEWTVRMVELNYLPSSRLSMERNTAQRTEIALASARLTLNNLINYGAPKAVAVLEAGVEGARSVLTFREMRLKRHEERLVEFQKQVERCTIRAPHDGFLIYANEDDDDTRIEEGAQVRQKQDLFFLPDLSQMEVETDLHETIVDRVRVGMPARIRIEAFPHITVEGHVVAVAPLPQTQKSWRTSPDIKNFTGRVKIDTVPEGLRPGMTAEVEILTGSHPDVLVIPNQALETDNGRKICYVARGNTLERREIRVGDVTSEMIEVVAGLDEGEAVVADPNALESGKDLPITPLPQEPRLADLFPDWQADPGDAQPAL